MYLVEINNNIITGKIESKFKSDGQIEVTKKIFKNLTNLPSDYIMENNVIVSVTPHPMPLVPTPLPTETERVEALEQAVLELMLGGM